MGSGERADSAVRGRVVVTAGGSVEPIDEVRVVANVSTGATGVRIAGRLLERGFSVDLLLSEFARVRPEAHPRLRVVAFSSAQSLLERIRRVCAEDPAPAWLVHAAAVADYRPRPVSGKISSGRSELVLRLEPVPKIADLVAREFPRLPLLLFKLEAGVDERQLRRRAEQLLRRVGARAVVANRIEDISGERHPALVLGADGSVRRVADLEGLAEAVAALVGAGAGPRREAAS